MINVINLNCLLYASSPKYCPDNRSVISKVFLSICFVHFYAKGYWEATPSPISHTRDTIHWEVTK
ncbi:MAG: hypothetical protein RIF34_04290, partial [Candidatus Kapaibacterium sp.]